MLLIMEAFDPLRRRAGLLDERVKPLRSLAFEQLRPSGDESI
jgi:hypothetical protein